ncbi:MAG TPA: methyltransferase domain-containing protein [Thermomicrobiaceae bacterium]|nr:methyltransferase domain-containing protein [Thermomicrobiaceae bacterium]
MSEQPAPGMPGWDEDDSDFFLRWADIIIPRRAEQLALLSALVPLAPQAAFVAVDLACGAGELSRRLLERFPRCRVIAFDGSPAMLDAAAATLAPFGARAETRRFDLFADDWRGALPDNLGCVVSSLALHHLPGPEKRRLYRELARHLAPGGALLVQDIVDPTSEEARRYDAERWDAWARSRSLDLTGELSVYERFRDGWNHFATPDPDDQPSPLGEQLAWLTEAGLERADCFALFSGFAVFGAFAPGRV